MNDVVRARDDEDREEERPLLGQRGERGGL
jgi:hypothetical protein